MAIFAMAILPTGVPWFISYHVWALFSAIKYTFTISDIIWHHCNGTNIGSRQFLSSRWWPFLSLMALLGLASNRARSIIRAFFRFSPLFLNNLCMFLSLLKGSLKSIHEFVRKNIDLCYPYKDYSYLKFEWRVAGFGT